MIRPVVQLGSPILKARCRPLAAAELGGGPVQTLVRDMMETLEGAGAVGLAAPQVGEPVRLILARSFPSPRNPDRPDVPLRALVNPHVAWASPETDAAWEGCLSFLDYRVRVVRPIAVRLEFLNPDGSPGTLEASGFYARVLQHEIDHLDGILTLDRAESPADVERVDAG